MKTFILLKHKRPSNSVPFNVSVMEEGVEEREERVTQQQSLFHGCTSQRAESCRILRLTRKKKVVSKRSSISHFRKKYILFYTFSHIPL